MITGFTPKLVKASPQVISNNNQYVFNTNSHINTGISVNPGDKIKITASGRIVFGFFAGSGGPRGIIFNPDYNYFVDIPHGHLIGRIRLFGMQDLDGWFPVGEGREIVVNKAGVLEFAVNDNKPGDNTGNFRIEVTINPNRSQAGNPPQAGNSTPDGSQVLVSNSRPAQCNHVLRNGSLLERCNKFQMLRIVDRKNNLDVFSLDFEFQSGVINYAIGSKPINTSERGGKTFRIYPVVAMFRIQPGKEPESLLKEGDRKTCAIAADYSQAACGYSDISSVLYTR